MHASARYIQKIQEIHKEKARNQIYFDAVVESLLSKRPDLIKKIRTRKLSPDLDPVIERQKSKRFLKKAEKKAMA